MIMTKSFKKGLSYLFLQLFVLVTCFCFSFFKAVAIYICPTSTKYRAKYKAGAVNLAGDK